MRPTEPHCADREPPIVAAAPLGRGSLPHVGRGFYVRNAMVISLLKSDLERIIIGDPVVWSQSNLNVRTSLYYNNMGMEVLLFLIHGNRRTAPKFPFS